MLMFYFSTLMLIFIGAIVKIALTKKDKRRHLDILNSDVDQKLFLQTNFKQIRIIRTRKTVSPGYGKLQPPNMISVFAPDSTGSGITDNIDFIKIECITKNIPYNIFEIQYNKKDAMKMIEIVKQHKCEKILIE